MISPNWFKIRLLVPKAPKRSSLKLAQKGHFANRPPIDEFSTSNNIRPVRTRGPIALMRLVMFAGLMSSRGRKAEKRVGPGKAQIGGLFVVFFWRGSRIVVLGTFRIEWFERTAKGKPCPSLKDSPNSNLKAHPGAMLPCRKQLRRACIKKSTFLQASQQKGNTLSLNTLREFCKGLCNSGGLCCIISLLRAQQRPQPNTD